MTRLNAVATAVRCTAPNFEVGGLDMCATMADRGIDVQLRVPRGQVVAVLGPNGAGKTSLLSIVAGLQRPDSGRLVIDGTVMLDTDHGAWVPAHHRGVALLAQQAMLFPHMTAVANVAFGPRSRGESRKDAHTEALQWLAAVGAVDLSHRRPVQLSGGQAQRIAIARALAARPALMLLDEPMAALDVAVAPTLRQLLRRVLRDNQQTAVIVTHDILDALSLADRAIVMDGGRIVEDGPVRDVLARPRSRFAAKIAGIDLLAGVAGAHGLTTPDGADVHGISDPACRPGDPAVAVFSPRAVAVHLEVPTGSPRNHFPVTIAELEPHGDIVRVRATDHPDGSAGLVADLTAAAVADLDLVPGQRAHFAVKATEISIYPASRDDLP